MVRCLRDYVLFFHYQLFLSGGVSYPVSEIVTTLNVYYKYHTYCNDVWDIVKDPLWGKYLGSRLAHGVPNGDTFCTIVCKIKLVTNKLLENFAPNTKSKIWLVKDV